MQDLTAGLPLSFTIHEGDGLFSDTDEGNAQLWNRLETWDREGSLIACAHHGGDTVHNILSDHACVTLLAALEAILRVTTTLPTFAALL